MIFLVALLEVKLNLAEQNSLGHILMFVKS